MNIYELLIRYCQICRNIEREIKWRVTHREEIAILKKNRSLKNSHVGERCFIIGNGPSTKKQNLSLLKNEFVFTVNRMSSSSHFSEINSNIHIFSDMGLLSDTLFEKGDMVNVLQSINTDKNKPLCFFPIAAKPILEKFQINDILKIMYFKQGLMFYENYKGKMDMCDLIIEGSTVVLVAMVIAIYMGFKEINLLGCDCTGAKGYIDSYGKDQISEYSFDIPKEQGKLIAQNVVNQRTTEHNFKLYYYMFRDYRIMQEYCNRCNITIFNCTEGGILDSFPLKTLKQALNS